MSSRLQELREKYVDSGPEIAELDPDPWTIPGHSFGRFSPNDIITPTDLGIVTWAPRPEYAQLQESYPNNGHSVGNPNPWGDNDDDYFDD